MWEDLSENEKKVYFDKAETLLTGLFYCTKTWYSWEYGTMWKSDFIEASKDPRILNDTAKKLFEGVY